VDTLLKVHRQARTRLSTIESIFKDKPALMLYASPYVFHGRRDRHVYGPALIHKWQSGATDVRAIFFHWFCPECLEKQIIGPVLSFMTQTLMWLTSPLPFDPQAEDAIQRAHEQIGQTCDEQSSILDTSMLDNEFFDILESSYMHHLKRAMLSFGQQEEMSLEQMSMPIVSDDDDDDMPPLASPIPLLSILFYTDLAMSLANVSDGIAIVSIHQNITCISTNSFFYLVCRLSTGLNLCSLLEPNTSTPPNKSP